MLVAAVAAVAVVAAVAAAARTAVAVAGTAAAVAGTAAAVADPVVERAARLVVAVSWLNPFRYLGLVLKSAPSTRGASDALVGA